MILLDLNQIFYSSMYAIGTKNLDENLMRHVILNSIKNNRQKFLKDWGEMTIVDDGFGNWREDFFPYYKARRKKKRAESTKVDWKSIFTSFAKIKEEIKTTFPYKFIRVDKAEADDCIAVMATLNHELLENSDICEVIVPAGSVAATDGTMAGTLIVSGDDDFVQLQKYMTVKQYSPVQKKWIIPINNPESDLIENIMMGCYGDDVPNILSDDDTFVHETKTQVRMTKKRVEEVMKDITKAPFYNRNKTLIDLSCTPQNLREAIIDEYNKPVIGDRSLIYSYMVKNRCSLLLDNIREF